MKKIALAICFLLTVFLTSCNDSPVPPNPTASSIPPTSNTVKWAVPEGYGHAFSPNAILCVNEFLAEYDLKLEFVSIPFEDPGYMQFCLDYEAENGPLDILLVGLDDPQSLRCKLLKNGYCIPLDGFLLDNPEIKALFSENLWKTGSISDITFLFPWWPPYTPLRYAFDGAHVTEADLAGFTGMTQQLKSLWASATPEKPVFFDADIETMLPFDTIAGVALSHDTGKAAGFFSDEGYGELIRVICELRASGRLAIFANTPPPKTDKHTAYVTTYMNWEAPERYLLRETKPYIVSRLLGLGIRADSPRRDEALKLLQLVHTNAELANLLIYGEEGVDYMAVDGYAHKMNGDPHPARNEFDLGFSIYRGVLPSRGSDWNATRPQALGPDPVAWLEKHTRPSPFLGFYPDTSGYEQQVTALEEIKNRFIYDLYNEPIWAEGEIEVNLSALRQKSQEAGLEEWLTEINRQLDEFWARR